MKKRTTKTKKPIQNKLDHILHYLLNGDSRVISKEEIGLKFFDSDDPVVCRVISGGYIPQVRRILEDKHNRTLKNIRGKGWQITAGGMVALKATLDAEKRMDAFKDSYTRKVKTLDLDKFPKQIRDKIKTLNSLIRLLDNAHTIISDVFNGMAKMIK